MATSDLVRPLYYAQLNNDSREQTLVAGANWQQQPLGFYYSNEASVDFGVKATMIRILMFEHATLPEDLWTRLKNEVNRTTLAGDAVETIADISSGANPTFTHP